jgi:L-threonylcarbamoyladenylate synthase
MSSAVARVFAAKGRPRAHPLIVHLGARVALEGWAEAVPEAARRLAAACWPGPLTLVLRRGPEVALEVTGGLETVAIRVPSHPVARALLDTFGRGVAAPSANRFGRVSATAIEHVLRDLGDAVDYLLEGDACEIGVESTIVDVTGARPVLLRPGGIPRFELEKILGEPLAAAGPDAPAAPGTLPSHYAPAARVLAVRPEELSSALAGAVPPVAVIGREVDFTAAILSPTMDVVGFSDAQTFARELYATLRALDDRGIATVVAVFPPERGLGETIADRLRRAAAPRSDS